MARPSCLNLRALAKPIATKYIEGLMARPQFPRQIPFIIGNEACERFSFYGMRNILTTFLATSMFAMLPAAQANAEAKEVFHIFVMGVYFFPLLGGWISDNLLGKYRTIYLLSLVYCVGHACLAIFESNRAGFYVGLGLIALGSGGIKPLVSSFVGDQFDSTNKELARVVFDIFYWSVNFGSFFATLIIPTLLKEQGASVAFGVPGVLMFIATAIFIAGRKKYVTVLPLPPNPDSFTRVIRSALTVPLLTMPAAVVVEDGKQLALSANSVARAKLGRLIAWLGIGGGIGAIGLYPWLEPVPAVCLGLVIFLVGVGGGTYWNLPFALQRHPAEAVDGVRAVLRVLIVFALVTPFWSLFDQKASTWVLQAGAMAKPSWLLPAHIQMLNPALVMLLIPFNNMVLYPWIERRTGQKLPALRKMAWGMFSAALAWVIVGAIQLTMDGGSHLSIWWQIVPYVFLTFGEVLVAATGLEFAYSQAPLAMKGVIMSFWNLAVTIGNLWVLLSNTAVKNDAVKKAIAQTGVSNTAFLMFFFAAFAVAAGGAFLAYAKRYRYTSNYR